MNLHVLKANFEMKKIIIHAMNFYPEMIGAGKYTGELAFHLSASGHTVEVITAPPHYPGWKVEKPYRAFAYRRENLRGLRIWRCPILTFGHVPGLWRALPPISFALLALPLAFFRVLWSRPDVVICVEPTIFSAPAVFLAARLIGARTILHVQDLEIDAAFAVGKLRANWLRWLGLKLERAMIQLSDRVVTISRKMQEALIHKGARHARTSVLRNWVDLSAIFPLDDGTRNAYRQELTLAGKCVVLYAGHIGAKQGLDILLECAELCADAKHLHFVICGEGPLKRELVARYGECANVSFLRLQPVERLNELLNLADIHVLAQGREVTDLVRPSKLAGMLASGRPVVATVEPGTELGQLLANVGVLTPPGDAASLAHAIRCIQPDALQRMGAKSRRLSVQFSAPEILEAFEALVIREEASCESPVSRRHASTR